MAKKKVTITIDEDKVKAIESILSAGSPDAAPSSSVSGWIEDAVASKLERAERADRAVQWLVDRAQSEHRGEWEQALEAVRAADARHGFTSIEQGQSAA
jgi:predicted LPLAT superfamily acyltransferase